MKNKITKASFLFFLLPFFTSVAQESEVDLLVNDMLKIAGDFAAPAAAGASYQSGAGWFASAKSLDLWEVDFSVHANILFVPEERKSTTISSGDYKTFDIRGAETAQIPTAFGGATDVIFEGDIDYFNQNLRFAFKAIDGVNKDIVAHPFVQASVGLPFGTDFSVRFVPRVKVDDVNFNTYGFGLKHNFNQYFFNSNPADFQFAALFSYSRFDVDYKYPPVVIVEQVAELNAIEVDANLWLLQLISSKSFINSNWEVFGAAGVTNSNFGYTLGGSGSELHRINEALRNLDTTEFEFKGDIGFNYKTGNFMLSSMFSLGKFLNYNLGLHYRL